MWFALVTSTSKCHGEGRNIGRYVSQLSTLVWISFIALSITAVPWSLSGIAKKTESCLIFPKRETIAHFTRWNAGATQADVSGSDNGNTHSSIYISTHYCVRLLPFLSQFNGQRLKQALRFLAYEAIGGDHEWCKMTSLRNARREVFPLFFSFRGLPRPCRVFREIALCVCIGDTDINDAIGLALPKTTDTQVSSVGISVLMQVEGN
jgi:hypothetical protein